MRMRPRMTRRILLAAEGFPGACDILKPRLVVISLREKYLANGRKGFRLLQTS